VITRPPSGVAPRGAEGPRAGNGFPAPEPLSWRCRAGPRQNRLPRTDQTLSPSATAGGSQRRQQGRPRFAADDLDLARRCFRLLRPVGRRAVAAAWPRFGPFPAQGAGLPEKHLPLQGRRQVGPGRPSARCRHGGLAVAPGHSPKAWPSRLASRKVARNGLLAGRHEQLDGIEKASTLLLFSGPASYRGRLGEGVEPSGSPTRSKAGGTASDHHESPWGSASPRLSPCCESNIRTKNEAWILTGLPIRPARTGTASRRSPSSDLMKALIVSKWAFPLLVVENRVAAGSTPRRMHRSMRIQPSATWFGGSQTAQPGHEQAAGIPPLATSSSKVRRRPAGSRATGHRRTPARIKPRALSSKLAPVHPLPGLQPGRGTGAERLTKRLFTSKAGSATNSFSVVAGRHQGFDRAFLHPGQQGVLLVRC